MKLGFTSRIFICLSVPWILGTSYFSASTLCELRSEKKYKIDRDDFGKFVVVFSAMQTEEEVGRYLEEETFKKLEVSPMANVGKVVRTPYDEFVARNQSVQIRRFLEISLVPVLGLLWFSWSLKWIIRSIKNKSVN